MMRSPDEIKKGLKCCNRTFDACHECPYDTVDEGWGCTVEKNADALALIQQLETRVPRWISVEERLPEPNTVVIVGGKGKVTSGIYHGTYGLWTTHGEIDFDYWMPLPEPPEEDTPC